MSHDPWNSAGATRRDFVKASVIPAAGTLAALWRSPESAWAEPNSTASPLPEIIDTNVHLFDWPFRRLKYARTEALATKLRRHRITRAWAGSFEAVLTKQLDQVNRRLFEECRTRGDGLFVPIGCVNPAWPGWDEDLRRCHEQYRMAGVRLYPAYHGLTLADAELPRLLAAAAERGLVVQIVLRLEDERVHHPALDIPALDLAPLVDLLRKVPAAKVQLLNAAGPLLGAHVDSLVRETTATFEIAATEGNGGVGRLLEGRNPSYRGAIPVDRLLFGSHAPFFPCETAVLKLFESPLSREQLESLMHANARKLLG